MKTNDIVLIYKDGRCIEASSQDVRNVPHILDGAESDIYWMKKGENIFLKLRECVMVLNRWVHYAKGWEMLFRSMDR